MHIESSHDLYLLLNIVRMIILRVMRLAGNVATRFFLEEPAWFTPPEVIGWDGMGLHKNGSGNLRWAWRWECINKTMNLWFAKNADNFLSVWGKSSLHWVGYVKVFGVYCAQKAVNTLYNKHSSANNTFLPDRKIKSRGWICNVLWAWLVDVMNSRRSCWHIWKKYMMKARIIKYFFMSLGV